MTKPSRIFSVLFSIAITFHQGFALPRIEEHSSLKDGEVEYQHQRRQADNANDELSPAEVEEDIHLVMNAVHNEEQKVGHPLQQSELQKLEEKMERLPWYRRFARWLAHHYEQLKATFRETKLEEPLLAIAKIAVVAVAGGAG